MTEYRREDFSGGAVLSGASLGGESAPSVQRISFVQMDALREQKESLRALEGEAREYGLYRGRQLAERAHSSTCKVTDLEIAIEEYIDLKFGVRGVVPVNGVLRLIPQSLREYLENGVKDGFASYVPPEVPSASRPSCAPRCPSPAEYVPPASVGGGGGPNSVDSKW